MIDKDKVIQLAKDAGGGLESWATNPPRPMAFWFSPDAVQRFAQAIYRQGLEDAANVCDKRGGQFFDESPFAVECHQLADSIRAHAQNQPKNVHDGSVM